MVEQAQARRGMEPFDALLYRSEDDPRGRSDMLAVFVLDAAPDWQRVVETFERASREILSLRQRVVEPPLRLMLPEWVVDPDFDLCYHLRRARLPEPGSWRQFLDFLEPMTMSPLDRARPLWETTLVEGLEGGQAALITKMNHAITDGLGGQDYTYIIFDRQPDAPRRRLPPKPVPLDVTPRELLQETVRGAPKAAVGGAVRLIRSNLALTRTVLTKPREAVSEANAYLQSFKRVLMPPPVDPSPLMRRRSLRRRLVTLEVDLADLKRAAKSVGGSVNDGLLAAVCGGLRIYHEKLGVPVDALAVAIPISLRTADDPAGGNRWAGARLALPVGHADPASRIQLIREMVLEARAEPAANALSLVAPVVARIPSALLAFAVGDSMATHDVQVSNVPGSPDPIYLAGAKVTKMIPFGPLPGPAAMIVLNSYLKTGYIGINLDPAAITEPELFGECVHQGVQEVLSLGTSPSKPSNPSRPSGTAKPRSRQSPRQGLGTARNGRGQ